MITKKVIWTALVVLTVLLTSVSAAAAETDSTPYVDVEMPNVIGTTGDYVAKIWLSDNGQATIKLWLVELWYPDGYTAVEQPGEHWFKFYISHEPELPDGSEITFRATAYTDMGEFSYTKIIGVVENNLTYKVSFPRRARVGEVVTFKYLKLTPLCESGGSSVFLLNKKGDIVASWEWEGDQQATSIIAPDLVGSWWVRTSVTCIYDGQIHLEKSVDAGKFQIQP